MQYLHVVCQIPVLTAVTSRARRQVSAGCWSCISYSEATLPSMLKFQTVASAPDRLLPCTALAVPHQ